MEYFLKASFNLALLYLLYWALLRRLTFYQWNRIYFLGYSLLCFIIPLINIAPWISNGHQSSIIQAIPSFGNINITEAKPGFSVSNGYLIAFFAGTIFMMIQLLAKLLSYRNIKKRATLLTQTDEAKIYGMERLTASFSFGRSIFIDQSLYTGEALQKIIEHELVHVRQRHSIDIIVGELICALNWYNPFAWLIRKAMRENLEFIADEETLAKGYDRKDYQYLLLTVASHSNDGIVSHFSAISLKKRISMINAIKNSKLYLTRFLFVLPIIGLSLAACRNELLIPSETKMLTGRRITEMPTAKRIYSSDSAKPAAKARVITGRGISSDSKMRTGRRIYSSDSPKPAALVVVNGMIQPSGFKIDQLAPELVERITVLKGAAAIEQYGEKAKQGAIIIKNK